MCKVEFGGGCGVGHFSKDGDLFFSPVGEKFFRALLGEGWDFEFAAFPSDGGLVDSGSEGDLAVWHLSEEGDFFFCPVVPGFGCAGVATDAEIDPLFSNRDHVQVVDFGDLVVGHIAQRGNQVRGPVDGLGRTRWGDAELLSLFENSDDRYVELPGEGGIRHRSKHGDLLAGPGVSLSVSHGLWFMRDGANCGGRFNPNSEVEIRKSAKFH